MSKIRKALLTAGLLIWMVVLAGVASAASATVRFCWTVEGNEVSVGLFEKKEKEWYLFLPGALRDQDPVLRVSSGVDLVLGDRSFPDGSAFPADQYVGKTVEASLRSGKKLGSLTILRGSKIPAMFFTMTSEDFSRINMGTHLDIKNGASLVMVSGNGEMNAAEQVPSFKTHGNSTFFAQKRAYQFQMEHKVALDGMEKNKKWILLANWFDLSLIRNQMTFDLCREVGLTSTPDGKPVDLYINHMYKGTYLLTEKIQLKKGRLEITDLEETLEELNGRKVYDKAKIKKSSRVGKGIRYFDLPEEPDDVTGGYLLEIEKALQYTQMTDEAGFLTDQSMPVVVKEPTHAGRACVIYIAGLVNDFHNAVLAKDGISPATGKYYADFIDMDSFALKVIVDEFCASYDVRASSQFMYKDADSVDSRLHAGPGWDYDLSYGNKDDGMHNPLKLDYVYNRSSSETYLFHWLLTHDDFRAATRKLYEEVFVPAAEVLAGRRMPAKGSPLKSVAAYQSAIRESAKMNFSRWTDRGVPDIWAESGQTFESSGAFIRDWVDQRLDLMTKQWMIGDK